MAATASIPSRNGLPGNSPAGLRRRVAAVHLPRVPGPFIIVEALLWAFLYGLYLVVRGLSIGSENEALANARGVVDAERELGLDHEARLQNSFGAVDGVLSVYYVLGFAPLLIGVLTWLALRHRDTYRELRTLLLISIAFAVIVHLAVPVAPPRLVPELVIADTVGLDRDGSSFAGIPYNPYAAMPSMHVGWSLLVAVAAAQATGSLLARGFFVTHPAVMAVAVTVTGNHYFLDSIVGAMVALAALALWRLVPVVHSRLASRPQPACAYC